MRAIATQIRQALYSQRQNRLLFKSDWNPQAFVDQQEYAEEPGNAIEAAIVLVQGENGDTEAKTCREYLSRTWPLSGEEFMALVRHVVGSEPGLRCSSQPVICIRVGTSAKSHIVKLFDSTTITAWIEPSGCFTLEVAGAVETIVEIGEMYGWMTAALRSSPTEKITAITPILEISAEINSKSLLACFGQKWSDDSFCSVGRCWQNLFRNPVVVTGFPIRRRQLGQEPGLECSLNILTALLRTKNTSVFRGRVFVKGFCTMLVPTKYFDGTVHWHVLFNEDGSRISYTGPRVHDVVGDFSLGKYLTSSSINSARHIVGWCKTARNYAGRSRSPL